jgi:hypothetical protein
MGCGLIHVAILTKDENVKAYAVFVGSLGDQAQRLMAQLPLGMSFTSLM